MEDEIANALPARPRTNSLFDLLEMQTEFALLQSMKKSKTLFVMVVIGVIACIGFTLFLLHMAPKP